MMVHDRTTDFDPGCVDCGVVLRGAVNTQLTIEGEAQVQRAVTRWICAECAAKYPHERAVRDRLAGACGRAA